VNEPSHIVFVTDLKGSHSKTFEDIQNILKVAS
jgi:hypothetical protein